MRQYLKTTVMRVAFTKDKEGLQLIATGSTHPFKTTKFEQYLTDTSVQSGPNAGRKVYLISDTPMFCTHKDAKIKNFIVSAKMGLQRDERIFEVAKKDHFVKIANSVFVPPNQYMSEHIADHPLPYGFLSMIGGDFTRIDNTPAEIIYE